MCSRNASDIGPKWTGIVKTMLTFNSTIWDFSIGGIQKLSHQFLMGYSLRRNSN